MSTTSPCAAATAFNSSQPATCSRQPGNNFTFPVSMPAWRKQHGCVGCRRGHSLAINALVDNKSCRWRYGEPSAEGRRSTVEVPVANGCIAKGVVIDGDRRCFGIRLSAVIAGARRQFATRCVKTASCRKATFPGTVKLTNTATPKTRCCVCDWCPLSKSRAHITKTNTINYRSSRLDCTLDSAFALRRLLVPECFADVLTQEIVVPRLGEKAIDGAVIDRADNGIEVGIAGQHDADGIRVKLPHPR